MTGRPTLWDVCKRFFPLRRCVTHLWTCLARELML